MKISIYIEFYKFCENGTEMVLSTIFGMYFEKKNDIWIENIEICSRILNFVDFVEMVLSTIFW